MAIEGKKTVSFMRSTLYIMAVFGALLVIMGVDQCVFEGCDCEDAIDSLLEEKGTPYDFEILESGVTNKHTYWYLDYLSDTDEDEEVPVTKEYVFEWGEEDSEGNTLKVCCKESVTTLEAEETEEPAEIEDPEETEEPEEPETPEEL